MERSMKILVVEDEIIAALSLVEQLESWGHKTSDPATTLEDAVRQVEADKPDVVLMDINLHGKTSGIDAAKLIGELGIPVVFVSGYIDKDIKQQADKARPVAYLSKPLDFRKLKSVLDALPKA